MEKQSPKNIELNILCFLVNNQEVYKEFSERLKSLTFLYPNAKLLGEQLYKTFKEHQEIPTESEFADKMVSLAQERKFTTTDQAKLMDDLRYIYSGKVTGLTGEKIKEHITKEELSSIVEKLMLTDQDKLNKIIPEVKKTLDNVAGLTLTQDDLGLSVFSEQGIDDSLYLINQIYTGYTYPTGWETVDKKLLGGLRPKEVSCFLAPTGVGKTGALINLAANLVQGGYRVLYVAMDNPVNEITERIFACVARQPIVYGAREKTVWKDRIKHQLGGFNDLLFLKEYPPRQKSMLDIISYVKRLRSYLYKLDQSKGMIESRCGVIDVIIIDYLEKLKPAERTDAYRIELEIHAEYMLQLAHENNCHVSTGTQANREAMKSDETKLHHGQESIAKFNPMGVVLALSQTEEEKKQYPPKIRVSPVKVRRPAQGWVVPMIFDTTMQLLSEDHTSPVLQDSEENHITSDDAKIRVHNMYKRKYDNPNFDPNLMDTREEKTKDNGDDNKEE